MGQFDALVGELDKFQRWKGRKNAVQPRAQPAPASAPAPAPDPSFAKALAGLPAKTVDLRRRAAQIKAGTARLRAENAAAARARGFATLDAVAAKAMAAAADGSMTAVEAIAIERRCAAIAARLHAEDRAAKAGKAGR